MTLDMNSVALSDGNPCTADACKSGGGVTHTVVADGTACSAGNVCEGTPYCVSGACVNGTPTPTTSPNPCLTYTGTCNPMTGPVYASAACTQPTGAGANFDSTIATNLVNSAAFLWSGICTCTTSCTPGCISTVRVAVVRGRVLKGPGGSVVSGATVTILNHPESSATTRSDGWFDIPVNGGGEVTVQVQPPSGSQLFPAQRHVQTQWQQYAVLEDIWLTPYDVSTSVPLNQTGYVRAKGTAYSNSGDTTGFPSTLPSRTAQVLFPPSTTATFTFGACGTGGTCPSGQTCNSTTNLCGSPAPSSLTVRATEYTQGANGPSSLPADLPPSTAYTYAVELSADEAIAAGASSIAYSNPVAFYVENFLGVLEGSPVPVGYYDRTAGQWVPSADGRVIQITSFKTSGCGGGYSQCAVLNSADQTALNLSAGELNQLYAMYSTYTAPVSLWRMTTTHFTSYDLNWPPAPPGGGGPPPPPPPGGNPPPPVPNPCDGTGSIIECENQILAQQLPLAGTPFSLRYQSDRAPGRTPTLNIPLTGATVPPGLSGVRVNIRIAGVLFQYTYGTILPNQSLTWTWDRLDPYGDVIQGMQTAAIDVLYAYPGQYSAVGSPSSSGASFGHYASGGTTASGTRTMNFYMYKYSSTARLGVQDAEPLGLGGWTLSVNHLYDPTSRILWGGGGKRRTIEAATSVIQTVAGQTCGTASGDGGPAISALFQNARSLTAGPDGSYYVGDYLAVRRVDPQGNIAHFAGNGSGSPCPGTCVASTSWVNPQSLAVGPDGSVYVGSGSPGVVQKIDTSGNIRTIAGYPTEGTSCADALVGTAGGVRSPNGIAVAPDGTVWFVDPNCQSLRRIGTDGSLVTVTRTGCTGGTVNGGPVGQACLVGPSAVAVGPDGAIYVADDSADSGQPTASSRVRRIDPQTGAITAFAGGGGSGTGCNSYNPPTGDGLAALNVTLGCTIDALSVGADGTVYISDYSSQVIWSVDPTGIAHVIAGGIPGMPPNTVSDNGGPAQQGYVPQPFGVAAGSNGSVYELDYDCRVRTIAPTFPGYSPGGSGAVTAYIPSEDGSQVFGFDSGGRHLYTYDGTTGATLLTFTYDPGTHQLTQVTDINGNTTFAHSGGLPGTTTITPPYAQPSSQQTVLTLDATGHATALTNPNGEATQCTYSNGLMQSFKTPALNLHQFTYDAEGSLLTDQDPTGATQYLTRTLQNPTGFQYGQNWTTAIISGAAHTTQHGVTKATNGTLTQSVQFPSGASASWSQSLADVYTQTSTDGTVTSVTIAPDPRFGMFDPYPASTTVRTPAGKARTTTQTRTATGSNALLPTSLVNTTVVSGTGVPTSTSTATYVSSPTPTWTYVSRAGRQTAQQIDSLSRPTQISYPTSSLLVPTNIAYGATGGRLSSTTATWSGRTRTTTMAYDSALAGYLYSVTDPMSNVTTYDQRDLAGRVKDVELPNFVNFPKRKYSMTYDADGNLASLTVPTSGSTAPVHNFSNNSLDLLGAYQPPAMSLSTSQTSYTYMPDRQIQTTQVPIGTPSPYQSLSYSYDANGRLFAILDGSTGIAKEFTYNSADQVQSINVTDGAGYLLTNAYDGFLKTSTAWSGGITGSLGWSYDNFFRVSQRTVNSGNTVTYTYDADNLFTGTTAPASFTVTRDYANLNGRVVSTSLGSVSDSWAYNGFGELATYTATTGSTTLYSMSSVVRNNNGQITSMTETINGHISESVAWTFIYDELGRLTSAQRGTSAAVTYGYDNNGNRTLKGGTTFGTYDAQDRILTAPGVTYTYTNDGTNVTKTDSAGTRTAQYDLSGALRSIAFSPSGNTTTYHNDGLNRRIDHEVTRGSTTIKQQFLYDDQLRIAAELNGTTVTSVFVYGTKPNVPDYMWNGGKAYRIISDQLGSVRLVVDTTTGAVVQQIDYDEFGNVITANYYDQYCALGAQCFPFQPFGFAGGLWDKDSLLVRFGARDYEPLAGRWASKDPLRFDGGQTNLYVYAGDDPINESDPSGKSVCSVALARDTENCNSLPGGKNPAQQACYKKAWADYFCCLDPSTCTPPPDRHGIPVCPPGAFCPSSCEP